MGSQHTPWLFLSTSVIHTQRRICADWGQRSSLSEAGDQIEKMERKFLLSFKGTVVVFQKKNVAQIPGWREGIGTDAHNMQEI